MNYTVRGILQARILECVAFPFTRGSSQPRDQTRVSQSPALADRLFTTSAAWEAHLNITMKSESASRSVVTSSFQPHGL